MLFYFIIIVCVHVTACMEFWGQHPGVSSILPPLCGFGDQAQVARLAGAAPSGTEPSLWHSFRHSGATTQTKADLGFTAESILRISKYKTELKFIKDILI